VLLDFAKIWDTFDHIVADTAHTLKVKGSEAEVRMLRVNITAKPKVSAVKTLQDRNE